MGLYSPIRGDIKIKGRSIVNSSQEDKNSILKNFGVLYQSSALFSSLTLSENIAMPLKEFSPLSDELISATASLKLSLVGLQGYENFSPSEISGGMKKRAGLARAMALDPDILFFDEPSAGLDPISSAELDSLILEIRDSYKSSMIIVTHELDSIFAIADRVIILDKNTKSIIEQGDPRELKSNSRNQWVRNFLNRTGSKG
ncbi:MAG TPA: polyamine ABC transporter ATP-binding protein [Phycisphaerales bacterium]|nr:polyamine ABC transporter ATP-binding protein [Phycisphaerales bacterium]